MAIIRAGTPFLTFINVFTVSPDEQQHLLDELIATDQGVMKQLPGYISASFHRSLDGTKVVNYAQWESIAAFQAMLQHPHVQPHLEKVKQIASRFDPGRYEVVYSEQASEACG